MYLKGIIKDAKELEFVIFCIESIASEPVSYTHLLWETMCAKG